ncbi:MAG: ATP-binding protein [Pseudomonadota bacterium]
MSSIAELSRNPPVLSPSASVAEAAGLFLDPACAPYLSLPVVDGLQPVGIITRHALQQIYMSRFGRDLHERKQIREVMSAQPILVDANTPVDRASRHITDRIGFPIREDFIVTSEGAYHGVGMVVDLLRAMEQQVSRRNEDLAGTLRELKESQLQLLQSEKMASLGQMVAGVAHEINTPLGYVQNNVEMLQQFSASLRTMALVNVHLLTALENPDSDPDHIAQAVQAARQVVGVDNLSMLLDDFDQLIKDTLFGCVQIGDLVIGLRDFSRPDRIKTELVDINECVNNALLIARNVIKDRAEVIRDCGNLPLVSCVPSQINQVLLNLITNAAQAIDNCGKILVRTRMQQNAIHIVVQDTGKGIPPEHLARIFDPFFTTKPVGQGTGLGLAVCYRIVQEHGGAIQVASNVGEGACFTVTLPLTGISTAANALA